MAEIWKKGQTSENGKYCKTSFGTQVVNFNLFLVLDNFVHRPLREITTIPLNT